MLRRSAHYLLLATFAAPSIATGQNILIGDSKQQTEAFFRIYTTFCIQHISNLERLRTRMGLAPQLTRTQANRFLQGQPGQAWLVPEKSGKFVLAMPSNKNSCSVYAQKLGISETEKVFATMSNSPPLNFVKKKMRDEVMQTPNGPVHIQTFQWSQPNVAQIVQLTLSTSGADTAPLQGIATAEFIDKY